MSVYEQLVGQAAAINEIQRAAAAAAAQRRREADPAAAEAINAAMSQAWLFTGPPGSGRSLAAQILAAALQCTAESPGCGKCSECKATMGRNHPDVTWVSTDLVTIKADEVRRYVAESYVEPMQGHYKIFIIEDADRMLPRTTNVLLKAIEEPADRTIWMLCTAAAADVLPTIRSRCRLVNLVTPSVQEVADLLVTRDGVDPQRALVAASAAQSHVGVARALATDPAASALRRHTLQTLTAIHTVGDAVLGAQLLLDAETMMATSGEAARSDESAKNKQSRARQPQSKRAHADAADIDAEQRRLMEALGLDPNEKVPAAVRAQIKIDAAERKRRKTRELRDMLDRELIYMEAFYRDVLAMQIGAEVALINADFAAEIAQQAKACSREMAIARMDALAQARRRLQANVAPALALEAALVTMVD